MRTFLLALFTLMFNVCFSQGEPVRIIIKLKPGISRQNALANASFQKALSHNSSGSIKQVFPNHRELRQVEGKQVDLSRIYQLELRNEADPAEAIRQLLKSKMLEYAEEAPTVRALYTPNDPKLSEAWHVSMIRAIEAWDIEKGDTNVVIGIVDTGIDLDHEDLKENIKYNYLDRLDGLDNDGDGYTDNFYGWDLGENDNNPQSTNVHHGVHVAGLASATTDNAKGIPAAGFRCKLLPVKIANTAGSLVASYEGIVYAADHGCHIINCSWGSTGGGGQFGQDVINYATFNRNALVIAAAGNNGDENAFFPANYQHVISVAASNSQDLKWTSSSYGYYVDISAPGEGVISTWIGSSYLVSSGTSMAAPVVAGCAGIVKSRFPNYTAEQVGEHLRVTSDQGYYSLNPGFNDKLGYGRVDLFNAVSQSNTYSVRINSKEFSKELIRPTDTVTVGFEFKNILQPVTGLTVKLRNTNPNIVILDSVFTVASAASLQTFNNFSQPFRFKVNAGTPNNLSLNMKLIFSASGYDDYQYFNVLINPDFMNVDVNDISTTVTTNGRIGYNRYGMEQGKGFNYKGNDLLFEAGLMIGNSSSSVSDCVRRNNGAADNDFKPVLAAREITPPMVGAFDSEAIFNDNNAANKMFVTVHQRAFAWDTTIARRSMVWKYSIKNNSSITLDSLHAGIFADWDVLDPFANKAMYDAGNYLGYIYTTGSLPMYAGIKILQSPAVPNHYALDNVSGGAGGIDMSTDFTTSEKFKSLKDNRPVAGQGTTAGNDVAHVVSSGRFSLNAGDSATVAVALIAGESLMELVESAMQLQELYDQTFAVNVVTHSEGNERNNWVIYPNPATDQIHFKLIDGNTEGKIIEVVSLTGQKVLSKVVKGDNTSIDISQLPASVYVARIQGESRTFRFVKK